MLSHADVGWRHPRGAGLSTDVRGLKLFFHGFPVVIGEGETPVPIPNTAVKPSTADGTAGVTPWESRSLPGVFPHAEGPAVAGLFGVLGCGLEPTALSLNGCQLIIETMQ